MKKHSELHKKFVGKVGRNEVKQMNPQQKLQSTRKVNETIKWIKRTNPRQKPEKSCGKAMVI